MSVTILYVINPVLIVLYCNFVYSRIYGVRAMLGRPQTYLVLCQGKRTTFNFRIRIFFFISLTIYQNSTVSLKQQCSNLKVQ